MKKLYLHYHKWLVLGLFQGFARSDKSYNSFPSCIQGSRSMTREADL